MERASDLLDIFKKVSIHTVLFSGSLFVLYHSSVDTGESTATICQRAILIADFAFWWITANAILII
jgi:hypothetical protein